MEKPRGERCVGANFPGYAGAVMRDGVVKLKDLRISCNGDSCGGSLVLLYLGGNIWIWENVSILMLNEYRIELLGAR